MMDKLGLGIFVVTHFTVGANFWVICGPWVLCGRADKSALRPQINRNIGRAAREGSTVVITQILGSSFFGWGHFF
jgi:hypothetical protein